MGNSTVITVQKEKENIIHNLFNSYTFILIAILACLLIFSSIFVPTVLQKDNIINVLRLSSILGLVAIGSTIVLLVGEIDLSVGSIMSLSLVIGGLLLGHGAIVALIGSYCVGIVLGIVNGLIITKFKISSLMVTLGTLSIFAGLANVATRGQSIFLYDSAVYLWVGRGHLAGIPIPVFLFLIVGIIFIIILKNTRLGKEIYFTGANEKAAWISGVNINKVKVIAYVFSGLCASLAGPLLSTQTNRITPIQGVGFELSAIAIAVLGGTSLGGGKGSIVGTLLGSIIFILLLNILTLSGVGTYMEQVLKGILLIVIVLAYQIIDKRKGAN